MGRGSGVDYVIIGGLMLASYLLGMRVKREKSFFAYLVVAVVLFFVAMAVAGVLAGSARPSSPFVHPSRRDPMPLALLLWAPYVLAGFLGWLFKPGKRSGAPAPGLVTQFMGARTPSEPSLARQTWRRVVVTVAAAAISYAILSFMGIADTPSILTTIGVALMAIVFG